MRLRERFDATDKKYYQISFMGEGFEEERALMFSDIDVLALIQCYYIYKLRFLFGSARR